MSSRSDDDPVKRSSTERYSRVASNLDWVIVLIPASSIFFGFLLHISVNPPSYFHFSDSIILLAALYAVTVATAYVRNSSYPSFDSLSPVRCREISFDNEGVSYVWYFLLNGCNVLGSRIGARFQATNGDCIWFSFLTFHLYFPSILQTNTLIHNQKGIRK